MATFSVGNQTVMVLYTDVSSTDPALTSRHQAIVGDILRRMGFVQPRASGDGVAATFQNGDLAVLCAVQIQRSFEDWGSSKPAAPVRVALANYEAAAAAVAGEATDGEILVTNAVRELTEPRGHLFTDRGELQLGGSTISLFAVRWWEHD